MLFISQSKQIVWVKVVNLIPVPAGTSHFRVKTVQPSLVSFRPSFQLLLVVPDIFSVNFSLSSVYWQYVPVIKGNERNLTKNRGEEKIEIQSFMSELGEKIQTGLWRSPFS